MNEVYLVLWNNNCFESAPETVSIHKTKQGAYKAMRSLVLKRWEEYQEHEQWKKKAYRKRGYELDHRYAFGRDEYWGIQTRGLQE